MRLGLIARMDKTGLGQGQTLRLARLLNPDHILLVDSTPFNGNEQHPEWYEGYSKDIVTGFPSDDQVRDFLEKVDIVISCEMFYNNRFTTLAKEMGVKTILIANPEFYDWFRPEWKDIPPPDKLVVPSLWKMDVMYRLGAQYIPTPIFPDEFENARKTNLMRSGTKTKRFLFINGKTAHLDRNGLESLYAALNQYLGDYEIVIKAQGEIKRHPDPRITYDLSNPIRQEDLYAGFDALVLPRRYAGQCLPMCEALCSALPVIMPNIDPNNKVLPAEWLVRAAYQEYFQARTKVEVYNTNGLALARKLESFEPRFKNQALELAEQYDAEKLRPLYERLIHTW